MNPNGGEFSMLNRSSYKQQYQQTQQKKPNWNGLNTSNVSLGTISMFLIALGAQKVQQGLMEEGVLYLLIGVLCNILRDVLKRVFGHVY